MECSGLNLFTNISNSNHNDSNQGHFSGNQLEHHDILTIFKVSENAVQIWKQKYLDRPVSYKLCIIDFKRKDSDIELKLDDYSSNISEYVNSKSKVETAVLNENECMFKSQAQFGRIFNPNEYVFLKATIDDISKWAYMIDFYVNEAYDSNANGSAKHIGYAYILPLNLLENSTTINTVITGNNHKPIGHLTIDYTIVKPLQGYSNAIVGCGKWSDMKQGLEVGHRGAGKWRRSDKIENVLENTIASFNYAAKHGADMVELDVHLSKDKVPVIYHDFTISISIKKKMTNSDPDLSSDVVRVTHAVKDLTLKELQMLKLSPVNNLNHDFSDNDPLENQPFPELKQVLESVPETCGFNIEIKYPMKKFDGSWDGPHNKELLENEFVDIILKTIFEHAGQRNIVLSTFHPDICILLRLKQNRFPVLFLTQGKTKRYTSYKDTRTNSTENATYMAKIFGFWGVNVHAEDLLRDRSLVQFVKKHNLILFTWGEDINSTSVITQLKNDGVDGIIYDKIDVYNTKFVALNSNIEEMDPKIINNEKMQIQPQAITHQSALVQ